MVNLHGGADSICAIVTATSVFAPRVADDVPAGKCKQTADFFCLLFFNWPKACLSASSTSYFLTFDRKFFLFVLRGLFAYYHDFA